MNNQQLFSDAGPRLDTPFLLKAYLQLFKLHLCLYISLSGIAGYVTATGRFSGAALILGGALLLLAMGSAVMNNIQDREYDKHFSRTCLRSLPCQKVTLSHARVLSALLMGSGLAGLAVTASWTGVCSGLAAVALYNGLYTPLKKKTLLAIVPGTVSGMMPVLIGWAAAGRPPFDPVPALLMAILGFWQVPHFFIILLKNGNEPSCRHLTGTYPCFIKRFSQKRIRIQILIWTGLYSLAVFCFLLAGHMDHGTLAMVLAMNALAVLIPVTALVITPHRCKLSFVFAAVNLSMLVFLTTGICDKASFMI